MKIPKDSHAANMIRTLAALAVDNIVLQRSYTGQPEAQYFQGKANAYRFAAKYVAKSITWIKTNS